MEEKKGGVHGDYHTKGWKLDRGEEEKDS